VVVGSWAAELLTAPPRPRLRPLIRQRPSILHPHPPGQIASLDMSPPRTNRAHYHERQLLTHLILICKYGGASSSSVLKSSGYLNTIIAAK
jgi:hypothetical protein